MDCKEVNEHQIEKVEGLSASSTMPSFVFIQTPSNKSLRLPVTSVMSVSTLKSLIKDLEGFQVARQVLTFNGVKLDDDQQLGTIGLVNNSVIQLYLLSTISVNIHTSDDQFSVLVNETDTILDLKMKIEKEKSLLPKYQSLLVEGNCLNDNCTVGYYELENNTVQLIDKSRTITFVINREGGEPIEVVAKDYFTVSDLKSKISKITKIPYAGQILKAGDVILKRGTELWSYHFPDKATLSLTVTDSTFEVYIKTLQGTTLIVGVHEKETILSIKSKIEKELDIPCSDMRLIFAGKELENDKSVQDYNIQKEATLHLVCRLSTKQK